MRRQNMGVFRKLGRRALAISLVVVVLLGTTAQFAAAEGSGSLTDDSIGSRASLEWRTSAYGDGTLKRRTLLKAFVRAGEYMLLGSSAVGVPDTPNKGDIRVYAPGAVQGPIGTEIIPETATFSCAEQRTQTGNSALGRIDSRLKEQNGPRTIANPQTGAPGPQNPNGYVPCFFRAEVTGIYDIVFLGPSGDGVNTYRNPTGSIADDPDNYNASQRTSIAIWDVTVRSSLTTTENFRGRLFAYYLAMFTGGNGRPVNGSVHVVTRDGFRYLIDLRGMDPNGFVLYGNQVGFLDTDGTPLYHDVMPQEPLDFEEQNQLSRLQGNVKLAPPDFPIFFDTPDESAIQAIGIPLEPVLPQIDNFTFAGALRENTTTPGKGGTFSFTSTVGGVYEIVISRDGRDFDPAAAQNRVLRGIRTAGGTTTVAWDGLDNSGEPFPTGNGYLARTTIHGGEFHFPFLDVENSTTGSPLIRMLNPPDANKDGVRNELDCPPLVGGCTSAVYDDRGYRTADGTIVGTGINQPLCPGNVGLPPNPLASGPQGYDSSTNQRRFGFETNGNPQQVCAPDGGFGDKKGLDLWTYYPSNQLVTPFNIIAPLAVDLASFTAARGPEGVVVRWETRSERGTRGFHILRSSDGQREHAERVTTALVPARGSNGGAIYTWTDKSAPDGATYWLQELETDGDTREYGPAVVARSSEGDMQLWVPFVAR